MRVAGVFAVIIYHVAGPGLYLNDVTFPKLFASGAYYGITGSWAVPVFVMISGTLFLNPNKDIPIRKIYSKYIFRIFTAFMFWSFVYAVAGFMKNHDLSKAVGHFITGRYHLWFLFMITGLYMIVPFMRKIAESDFLTKYFLSLAMIFAFVIPQTLNMLAAFWPEEYSEFVSEVVSQFHMMFVAEYSGYFLLGFVLDRINITRKREYTIYFLGIFAIAASVFMSFSGERKPLLLFYRPININTMLYSSAIFVFFRKYFNYESDFILKMSKYSFGAYLAHDAVIELLRKFGLHAQTFCPVISVPITAVAVFIVSFIISAILNHIPLLKKYIV